MLLFASSSCSGLHPTPTPQHHTQARVLWALVRKIVSANVNDFQYEPERTGYTRALISYCSCRSRSSLLPIIDRFRCSNPAYPSQRWWGVMFPLPRQHSTLSTVRRSLNSRYKLPRSFNLHSDSGGPRTGRDLFWSQPQLLGPCVSCTPPTLPKLSYGSVPPTLSPFCSRQTFVACPFLCESACAHSQIT